MLVSILQVARQGVLIEGVVADPRICQVDAVVPGRNLRPKATIKKHVDTHSTVGGVVVFRPAVCMATIGGIKRACVRRAARRRASSTLCVDAKSCLANLLAIYVDLHAPVPRCGQLSSRDRGGETPIAPTRQRVPRAGPRPLVRGVDPVS